MSAHRPSSYTARILHRYLGFFLAGIMAVYAISGVVLIFRNTDFLKHPVVVERTLEPALTGEEVAQAMLLGEGAVQRTSGDTIFLDGAVYHSSTGEVVRTYMNLPWILKQMTDLHQANTNNRLFFFNLFFGLSLLFFVLSAFWMYLPGGRILRRGLIYAAAGMVLTLLILFA